MLLIASHPDSILAFRGALISAMLDKGIDVHVAAPDLDAESIVCDTLKSMKVTAHKIPMDRHGVSPIADLTLLWHLTKLMRRIQPDILLNYTAKPIIHGRPFKLSQLNGRVALVFFGFTNCPDVCPLAMAKMMQLQASRGAELEDIAYVLISVDGERDTPEVMKKFLAQYSPRFIGLTGEPQSIKPIAKEFSVAFFKGAGAGHNYDVSHSPQVFVMDQAGRLRAEFYNASVEAMTGVTQAMIEEGGP